MHIQPNGPLDQNLLLQLSLLQLRLLPFRRLAHAGAARPSAASVHVKKSPGDETRCCGDEF